MAADNDLRTALVIVFAVFAPVAACFRIRSRTAEKLDRWQEGVFILFGLRLSGLPAFMGGAAWMIDPHWMAWSSVAAPAWLRWPGVVLVVCSASLVVWTFWNLGRNLTDTVVTRKEHALVTSGPFRFVRHPFYLSLLIGITGVSLAMANWFIPLTAQRVFQI